MRQACSVCRLMYNSFRIIHHTLLAIYKLHRSYIVLIREYNASRLFSHWVTCSSEWVSHPESDQHPPFPPRWPSPTVFSLILLSSLPYQVWSNPNISYLIHIPSDPPLPCQSPCASMSGPLSWRLGLSESAMLWCWWLRYPLCQNERSTNITGFEFEFEYLV
jgi:hypothetical protein